MSDIENLLMNYIRNSLEKLQHEGVGHIDQETSGRIFYDVDGRKFEIALRERKVNVREDKEI